MMDYCPVCDRVEDEETNRINMLDAIAKEYALNPEITKVSSICNTCNTMWLHKKGDNELLIFPMGEF